MTHTRLRKAVLYTWVLSFICLFAQPVTAQWRVMPIPFANFTADKGIGYGLFLSVFDERPGRQKPPYNLSVGGQFYQTTGGYAFHKFLVDMPRESYRLSLASGWENWSTAPYFGSGAQTIRDELRPIEYYQVDLGSLWIQPQARIPITESIEALVLVTYRHAFIKKQTNLLGELEPMGSDGGRLLLFGGGFMVDRRDREPTPTQGFWSEASIAVASQAIGSEFDMQNINLTHRHWWSLDPDSRWVLATRTLLDLQRRAPFFQESAYGGSQTLELGGHSMLRGLETGRVRGPRKAAQTLELHLRFNEARVFAQRIEPMLVTFGEAVYVAKNDASWLSSAHLLYSVGVGGRAVLNGAFVLRFDLGMTPEKVRDKNGASTWRNGVGSYLIVGHSF